jgi:endonuclease/exonuclease/phosphatase family metal-dependent hydrolase
MTIESARHRPATLVCATYNIHRCIGRDRRRDPERIRAVIHNMQAQIMALQEVELLHDAPDLLGFLTEHSDCTAVAGMTLARTSGQYGNAVLTSLPILHKEQIDISMPGREPRGVIRLLLQWGRQRIQLFATHLGLAPSDRRLQIKRILERIQSPNEAWNADVTLLMGDLNEWYLWGRPLRWLRRHFGSPPEPATFPAGRPLFALDRIWVEPRRLIVSLEAFRRPPAPVASDHLPLVARLDGRPASPR